MVDMNMSRTTLVPEYVFHLAVGSTEGRRLTFRINWAAIRQYQRLVRWWRRDGDRMSGRFRFTGAVRAGSFLLDSCEFGHGRRAFGAKRGASGTPTLSFSGVAGCGIRRWRL